MMMLSEDNAIYKTGLKMDYTPKRMIFEEDYDMSSIKQIACGSKHYLMVNEPQDILAWGNMFKQKAEKEDLTFHKYNAASLFEEGDIIDLSMRYGTFGAIVEHK